MKPYKGRRKFTDLPPLPAHFLLIPLCPLSNSAEVRAEVRVKVTARVVILALFLSQATLKEDQNFVPLL